MLFRSKEINKHDLDVIEWENQIYISEDVMVDLTDAINEDFGIQPMDGLM